MRHHADHRPATRKTVKHFENDSNKRLAARPDPTTIEAIKPSKTSLSFTLVYPVAAVFANSRVQSYNLPTCWAFLFLQHAFGKRNQPGFCSASAVAYSPFHGDPQGKQHNERRGPFQKGFQYVRCIAIHVGILYQ